MDIIKNLDKDNYKKISLDFYMDSLDKIGTAKITYNVIALESLFNVNRMDIKTNFIQRGVKLLQNFYDEIYWEAIEKDLEKAYKIRCDYTHGTSQRHKDATIELSEKISEYTRIILIVFLYLSPQVEALKANTKEKKYINEKLIDKSLLYPIINENFSKMMKNISVTLKRDIEYRTHLEKWCCFSVRYNPCNNKNKLFIYLDECSTILGTQMFLNAVQNYETLKGQQTNLFKCFLPQAWLFGNNDGISSFLHPDGVYDDPNASPLREVLYKKLKYHFHFINEQKLFEDVHHCTQFSLNVYSKNV